MKKNKFSDAYCSVCEKNFRIEQIWLEIAKDFPDRQQEHINYRCPDFRDHIRIERQKEVAKVPLESRQKILDIFRTGKTIGEVCKELNLSLDIVSEVIYQNIDSYYYLRTDAK